jgi:hypothetical protein
MNGDNKVAAPRRRARNGNRRPVTAGSACFRLRQVAVADPHRIEIWFALEDATVYLLAGGGERADRGPARASVDLSG